MIYEIVLASGDKIEVNSKDLKRVSLPDGLNSSASLELMLNPMEAIALMEHLWELPEFRLDQTLH